LEISLSIGRKGNDFSALAQDSGLAGSLLGMRYSLPLAPKESLRNEAVPRFWRLACVFLDRFHLAQALPIDKATKKAKKILNRWGRPSNFAAHKK
jgi:hypothetical protein